MDDVRTLLEQLREDSEWGSSPSRRRPPPGVPSSSWRGRHRPRRLAVVGGLDLAPPEAPAPEAPSAATPFTASPGFEVQPTFSPNGNEVAFAWNGEKEGNFDIYRKLIGPGGPLR